MTKAEWNKLDNFEGETYTRTTVEAIEEDGTRVEAYVYFWAGAGDALGNGEWHFTYFEQERWRIGWNFLEAWRW